MSSRGGPRRRPRAHLPGGRVQDPHLQAQGDKGGGNLSSAQCQHLAPGQVSCSQSSDVNFFFFVFFFGSFSGLRQVEGGVSIPTREQQAGSRAWPTCTGLARGSGGWSTMDSATFPPKECPTRTRGTSFRCLISCSTSLAADATEWGPRRCPAAPLVPGLKLGLEVGIALSPWQRRSTRSICQAGKSRAMRRANETQFLRLPRMPCRNTAVGGGGRGGSTGGAGEGPAHQGALD